MSPSILAVTPLPSVRALLAFPLLVAIVGVFLVAFALNGSSSGAMREEITASQDPDLLAGTPELVRGDEWNVQTVWAISQVQQGLPVTNETFPGGMDATIPQDLPRADWTVAFRPHLLGFNLLDIDRAVAWKWWLPGLALIAACYVFMVIVMPRRPVVAAVLSIGFFFSPLFQWWYLQTTLWPVVWGFAVMSAALWAMRSPRRAGSWGWAALVAYLTVVMAMGIYVPYILPVVVVVAFFVIGLVVDRIGSRRGVLDVAGRLVPVLVAGAVAGGVTLLWLNEKRATVDAFLGTAYPGERLTPTGESGVLQFVTSVASSFTLALKSGGLLGQNSSEASTVFFVGAFLLPVIVWVGARERRRGRRLPWTMIGLAAAIVLIMLFMFLPGWDAIAHVLFLDRMTGNRARIGIALAATAIIPLLVAYMDGTRELPGRILASVIALGFMLSQAAIAVALSLGAPKQLVASGPWWLFALLGAVALYCFARGRPALGAAAFLIVTVAGSVTVNPVYRGVYDLRETAAGEAVLAIDSSRDFAWVGVGDKVTTALLVETGVRAYNGFQGAPSQEMWGQIDPVGAYEYQWNRLAGVSWVPAPGEPVVSNPFADQIRVTFDGCSTFAQANVDYVISDTVSSDPCLTEVESFGVVDGELRIYRVD